MSYYYVYNIYKLLDLIYICICVSCMHVGTHRKSSMQVIDNLQKFAGLYNFFSDILQAKNVGDS